MSLTSYRAAPPRGKGASFASAKPQSRGLRSGLRRRRAQTQTAALETRHRGGSVEECKEAVVLGRPGNDLLSRVLRHSTIGAEEFNGRVRDGIGFLAPRSNHRTGEGQRQGRPRRHPELVKSSKVKVFLSPATLPDRKVRKPERAPAPLRRVFLCHDHGHES